MGESLTMFESILNESTSSISISSACICMLASIILGLCIAFIHMKTSKYSKSFVITLAVLPLLVQVIIMMVNGNLGTSVAVLGAFGLIRFRSAPGSAKEIISIFFAMAVGLAIGMGQILFAVLITVFVGLMIVFLSKSNILNPKGNEKKLKIVIPENLDYNEVFQDIFEEYLNKVELEQVKTTNLGSLYELSYAVSIKKEKKEKEFIDKLRCRNGNLNITLSREMYGINEL